VKDVVGSSTTALATAHIVGRQRSAIVAVEERPLPADERFQSWSCGLLESVVVMRNGQR